jgi:hypothetical protein
MAMDYRRPCLDARFRRGFERRRRRGAIAEINASTARISARSRSAIASFTALAIRLPSVAAMTNPS